MKWLDDAKRKAADATEDATARAREEAGKAMVRAAWSQVQRKVGALAETAQRFADGVLSSAEAELAEQSRARGIGGQAADPGEGPDPRDGDEADPSPEAAPPGPAEREAAASKAPTAPRDPARSAQTALEAAAEARRFAQQGSRAAAREARARDELERLRAQLGRAAGPPSDEPSDDAPTPPAPRKRTL